MKIAAHAILEFTAGLDAKTYAGTALVHSAVEGKFEIVGEALAQLFRFDPAIARRVPSIRELIAIRNLLIQGHAAVEHDNVWRIADASLPGLPAVDSTLLKQRELH